MDTDKLDVFTILFMIMTALNTFIGIVERDTYSIAFATLTMQAIIFRMQMKGDK